MKPRYGVLLVDGKEVIVGIYERNKNEYNLIHYEHTGIKKITPTRVTEVIANIFYSFATEHVIDWKLAARNTSAKVIDDISSATGFPIENITHIREQELLCKGILTEL